MPNLSTVIDKFLRRETLSPEERTSLRGDLDAASSVPLTVQLSAAAYSLLTVEQQNNGTIYFITDES